MRYMKSKDLNVHQIMFEFSGRVPQAGLQTLVGRIRPAGHTLETLGYIVPLNKPCAWLSSGAFVG